MDASPLQRLPAELRVEIYELVLVQKAPIFVANKKERGRHIQYRSRLPQHALAITITCKAMHREVAQMVFSCNKFSITGPQVSRYSYGEPDPAKDKHFPAKNKHALTDFVTAVGSASATMVGGIEVMLGEVFNEDLSLESSRDARRGLEIRQYLNMLLRIIPGALSGRVVVASVQLSYRLEESESSRIYRSIPLAMNRTVAADTLLLFAAQIEQEYLARTGGDEVGLVSSGPGQAANALRTISVHLGRDGDKGPLSTQKVSDDGDVRVG
ncbi:hypothetical protein LTR56_009452 [Elasticomyces elasticus]|nr:hypothetical protein LTR56_009452 [Elasticomyces elasticus]KAK3645884.1 hypothetical protein LTR22_014550 [Elasticomyces elasticus]KAK4931029.1 hypothetical protein LTR49_002444 [Elasticomyces elasticus]KAK5765496.1 hypothetical protein LTS12_004247 [Elasticomyces elasticus]